jgi:hypothetical protein
MKLHHSTIVSLNSSTLPLGHQLEVDTHLAALGTYPVVALPLARPDNKQVAYP